MSDHIKTARILRRNTTDAEKNLWRKIRNRQLNNLKFRRQHPIPPYIVDFFCEDLNLIIELDDGQHTPQKDRMRTDFLEKEGYRIVRFWNNQIFDNIEGVLMVIAENALTIPSLSDAAHKPHPLHHREEI